MNCPNCLTGYNTGANLPRILIGCGHTLCDYCIGLLFDKAALSITCPECFSASCRRGSKSLRNRARNPKSGKPR